MSDPSSRLPSEDNTASDPALSEILEQVMSQLAVRNRSGELNLDQVKSLLNKGAVDRLDGWSSDRATSKAGTGMGSPADVPWVGVFPPGSERRSATEGVYLVYLFAMDGSACFLSLNQGTERLQGGSKVLRKRVADLRRVVLGEPGWEAPPVLRSTNARPGKYEAGSAYAFRYDAGAVPSDHQLQSDFETAMGWLEAVTVSGLSWDPEIEPIHLLFKWNADKEPRTVDIHREIAETEGAVWWGRFAQPTTNRVAAAKQDQLARQLAAGHKTHAYLYRRGSLWRAVVRDATNEPPGSEDPRFPRYYEASDCNFFVLLADFEELGPEWATKNLTLVSNPDAPPDSFKGALSNQTTPLFVYEYWGAIDVPSSEDPTSELTMEWLAEETLWPMRDLEQLVGQLRDDRPQIILAGPPGTGKTWVARALARYLTNDEPLAWRVVQFHPTYGYEEFVEGIKPTVDEHSGAIKFMPSEGVVLEMAGNANTYSQQVLVIDEMNRANLPRVLGELMYALEYRGEAIDLLHSKGFELPENLLFIGTMNTVDRSIRSIDLALRRRFFVYECLPSSAILRAFWNSAEPDVPNLVEGFEALNAALGEYLDRHLKIGHTFFMPSSRRLGREDLALIWNHQIGPLVEEYFFDQPELAGDFTLDRFWPAS